MMACPTCSHTMQSVAYDGPSTLYWCPRCGSIRSSHQKAGTCETPKLVARCRLFRITLDNTDGTPEEQRLHWRSTGIEESIGRSLDSRIDSLVKKSCGGNDG